jgi:hypothetical protein
MFAKMAGVLCLACLVPSSGVAALSAAVGPVQTPRTVYDGHWWLSISGDEQFGFLNGYFDCYNYEFKGPDRYPSLAVMYRTAITEFYKRGPSPELGVVVLELLHRLRDTEPPPAMEPFGGQA